MSAKQPPMTWSDMGLRRPAPDAEVGTTLNLPGGRVLVRSYDTTNSAASLVTGDPDGDHQFDDTSIPLLEPESAPLIGDTVLYLGEVRGDSAVNVWCPMRVVWVGPEHDGYLLTEPQQDAVKDLATSLKPANATQAAALLSIFTCDWVLDRKEVDW